MLSEQRMSITCATGLKYLADQCYAKCPAQMIPLTTDETQCVSSVTCPPFITTADVVDSSLCNKVVFEVDPVTKLCTNSSYTQWNAGQCVAPCPPGFIENGLSCLKKTLDRHYSAPYCSNFLYAYEGGACRISWFAIALGLFLLVAIIYFAMQVSKPCYAVQSS
jgi:hypothetical protein